MQFVRSTRSLAREECRAHQALPVRDLWIDVSRLRIHCLRAGRRGSPPVLLLHGGGLDAAGLSLRNAIPALAEQHRVFAPDWPGFGQSDAIRSSKREAQEQMHLPWRSRGDLPV